MRYTQSLSKDIRVIVLFFVVAALCFYPQKVNASCVEPSDPEAELESSDAVFTGGVVYISAANGILMHGVNSALISLGLHPADYYDILFPGRRIVFEVDRSWKGVTTSSVMIRTGYSTGNSSGYPFEVGNYYLVYASHAYGDPAKYLLTSLCHRTLKSPNNSEDIAYLNNLPTLELNYFPAIIRTLDSFFIIAALFLAGLIYIFRRNRKSD